MGKPVGLRNIPLNSDGMGESSAKALAEYLDDPMAQIESVFLGCNPIGDAGIAHLAPAFTRHNTLQRISLTFTGLTPNGIDQLCIALKDHPSLTTLDLSMSPATVLHEQRFNWIDGACILTMADLIKSPKLRLFASGDMWISKDEKQIIELAVLQSDLVNFSNKPRLVSETIVDDAATRMSAFSLDRCGLPNSIPRALDKNVQIFYPHIHNHHDFQKVQNVVI